MRVAAAFLSLLLGATPALADYPNALPKNPTPKHQLRKVQPKTTVHPQPAPAMDPSAGSGGYGAPPAGASNGNET